jgi:hypothetical protein
MPSLVKHQARHLASRSHPGGWGAGQHTLTEEHRSSTTSAFSPQAPGTLECKGFDLVGYHDLDGHPGFKLAIQQHGDRWLLYLGHLWRSGWSILDVTDAANPCLVRTLDGPPNTWTIQVQLARGLLITGLEKPGAGWGTAPGAPFEEGALVWDVETNPTEPKLLGAWHTGTTGTHRNFFAGGRYVYMAGGKPGYIGNLLRIVDISDPGSPREVSSWAAPEQVDTPSHPGLAQAYFHGPAYLRGDRAYLSYGRLGLVVLDISDVREPRLVTRLSFGDLGGKIGCHSAVPVPGRDLLVVNSEAIEEGSGDPLNYAYLVDISDDTAPRAVSSLPLPKPQTGLPYSSYYRKGGRFGPHNQHHYQGNPAHLALRDHVLMTYFNAGLRLFDITDPLQPAEVGWFVPGDPQQRRGALPTTLVTQFEDVLVDARGYIYCTDKNHGLFVLRYPDGLR